jgi:hypothetical protein
MDQKPIDWFLTGVHARERNGSQITSGRCLLSNSQHASEDIYIYLSEDDVVHFFLVVNHNRVQSSPCFWTTGLSRPDLSGKDVGEIRNIDLLEKKRRRRQQNYRRPPLV